MSNIRKDKNAIGEINSALTDIGNLISNMSENGARLKQVKNEMEIINLNKVKTKEQLK